MERKKLNIQLEENVLDSSLENNSQSNTWELLTELHENSLATRREIEGLTNLITLKDNHIKDAEDKLSELEIKLYVYKEKENIYREKIKDKDDLITALSLDSTYIKTTLHHFMDQFSTMIIENKLKVNEKDEQIAVLESKIKERDNQVALMEPKFKEKDVQIAVLESKIKERDDQVALMEPKIKKKDDQIAVLESKIKERDDQVALMESNIEKINEEFAILESKIKEARIYIPNQLSIKVIHYPGLDPFELSVTGDGWLIIQRRFKGNVCFDRGLDAYIEGFGSLKGDFCLGLEKIHKITTWRPHELFVEMYDYNDKHHFAHYNNFVVGSKDEKYKLKSLGAYRGSDGDIMRHYENLNYFNYSGEGSDCPNRIRLNFNGKFTDKQICESDYLFWGEEPKRVYIKSMRMYIRRR